MRLRTWLLFVLALFGSCRGCDGAVVEGLDAGFTASPVVVEFGRALEGTTVTRTVTLVADTRASVSVSVVTSAPFSAASNVEVPGGGEVNLPVVFTAGGDEASGTLTLSSGRGAVTLALHGIGVHPPVCTPTATCRTSTYSFELDACVEAVQADDTPCDTGAACLVNERCRSGACVGVARDCDDQDVCTVDACAPSSGCVHTARGCPAPTAACRRATCDPLLGCGETNAPDGELCGTPSCVELPVCVLGGCTKLVPPEGSPCGIAVACLPAASCHQQVCVQPDAGAWVPTWSLSVEGESRAEPPALLATTSTLFAPVCADGGCALTSWTSTGYERFSAPLGEAQQLVHVSPRGVLLSGDAGLELRSQVTGAVLEATPLWAQRDAVAFTSGGAVLLLLDGGDFASWLDGGVTRWGSGGDEGALALDSRGEAFSWSASRTLRWSLPDGGGGAVVLDAGSRSLTVAGGYAVVGCEAALHFLPDGGAVASALDQFDAGSWWLEPRGVLQTSRAVVCVGTRDAGTQLWVKVHDLDTGALRWAAGLAGTQLVEAALFDVPGLDAGLAVGVLSQADAGPSFQVLLEGQQVLQCPLSAKTSTARAAVFQGHQLVVLGQREDGGLLLEAYELDPLPLHQRDWSAAGGFQGWRRAQ